MGGIATRRTIAKCEILVLKDGRWRNYKNGCHDPVTYPLKLLASEKSEAFFNISRFFTPLKCTHLFIFCIFFYFTRTHTLEQDGTGCEVMAHYVR